MKHIKTYEFFEYDIPDNIKKLAIELEFKFRTTSKEDMKDKTIFQIIKELGFNSDDLSGAELGQILQYQMKFNKNNDNEFLKFYNEYKKSSEN